MSHNAVETSFSVEPVQVRSICSDCTRKLFCQRVHKVLTALALAQETHEDLEYQIRFRSLLQELLKLGFDFPEGSSLCELARLGSREAKDLLREAQELLIDVRELHRFGASEDRGG